MTGASQPEAERRRKVVPVRLSPEARERLDAFATGWGVSRSAAVERMIAEARPLRARTVNQPKTSVSQRNGK